VILEVGLGGRLDAVNVVDADVAMITSIALDHCEWLGNDVETIGREKAGIMRRARPAIYGDQQMPNSIADIASELSAPLLRLGHDFGWTREATSWNWRGLGQKYENLPPPGLHGQIQLNNASAVIAALTALSDRLPVTHEAIDRGLRTVVLSGRFQQLHRAKHPTQWIVDVAHNPAAATTLAAQLANAPVRGRTIAVCSILGDKDVENIGAALTHSIDEWIVCGLEGPRALSAEVLAARLRAADIPIAHTAENVTEACRVAEQLSRAEDRVIVFGSFLTVAAALHYLDAGA